MEANSFLLEWVPFQKGHKGNFDGTAQNIDYGYSLESLHRGGFNEYPQSMFLNRNKKKK